MGNLVLFLEEFPSNLGSFLICFLYVLFPLFPYNASTVAIVYFQFVYTLLGQLFEEFLYIADA